MSCVAADWRGEKLKPITLVLLFTLKMGRRVHGPHSVFSLCGDGTQSPFLLGTPLLPPTTSQPPLTVVWGMSGLSTASLSSLPVPLVTGSWRLGQLSSALYSPTAHCGSAECTFRYQRKSQYLWPFLCKSLSSSLCNFSDHICFLLCP